MKDPHSNLNRGFAFIHYVVAEGVPPGDLDRAIAECTGRDLHGRPLVVQRAKRTRARSPTPGRYMGKNPSERFMMRGGPPQPSYYGGRDGGYPQGGGRYLPRDYNNRRPYNNSYQMPPGAGSADRYDGPRSRFPPSAPYNTMGGGPPRYPPRQGYPPRNYGPPRRDFPPQQSRGYPPPPPSSRFNNDNNGFGGNTNHSNLPPQQQYQQQGTFFEDRQAASYLAPPRPGNNSNAPSSA